MFVTNCQCQLERFASNLAGKIRRETFGDTEYLVAPLTLIVPGVLNGSRGPVLYEPDDIAASVDAWNGMPMLLNHPTGSSGRTPHVYSQSGLGRIYNARFANGKLIAEGWFDIARARRIAPYVLSAIQSGNKVEVSTGLHLDKVPRTGNHAGVYYESVARNYRPDHLAILPDEVGACSVSDGCGVNNTDEEYKVVPLGLPRYDFGGSEREYASTPAQYAVANAKSGVVPLGIPRYDFGSAPSAPRPANQPSTNVGRGSNSKVVPLGLPTMQF